MMLNASLAYPRQWPVSQTRLNQQVQVRPSSQGPSHFNAALTCEDVFFSGLRRKKVTSTLVNDVITDDLSKQAWQMIRVSGSPTNPFVADIHQSLCRVLLALPQGMTAEIIKQKPVLYVGKTNQDTLKPWVNSSVIQRLGVKSFEDLLNKSVSPAYYMSEGVLVFSEDEMNKLLVHDQKFLDRAVFHELMHFVDDRIGELSSREPLSVNPIFVARVKNDFNLASKRGTWPDKNKLLKMIPDAFVSYYFINPFEGQHPLSFEKECSETFAECMAYLFDLGMVDPDIIRLNYAETLDFLLTELSLSYPESSPVIVAARKRAGL